MIRQASGISERGPAEATRHPYPPRMCLRCGGSVPPQFIGQPRKYCSDRCRSAYRSEARRKPRPTFADRLARKLRWTEQGCREFTGYRNEHGYGVIRGEDGGTLLTHRAMWIVTNGPIPDDLYVLHTCDNPPCCNVEHLRLGSHLDNMRDRDQRKRTLAGELCARTKLTDDEVRRIRRLAEDGRSQSSLALEFGIATSHVSYIVRGLTRRTA